MAAHFTKVNLFLFQQNFFPPKPQLLTFSCVDTDYSVPNFFFPPGLFYTKEVECGSAKCETNVFLILPQLHQTTPTELQSAASASATPSCNIDIPRGSKLLQRKKIN
jgi:hypothetical protein